MDSQEVVCPKCGHKFETELMGISSLKKCPNCGNLIDLKTIELTTKEQVENSYAPRKEFSTLRAFGNFISGVGWVCVVISIVFGLVYANTFNSIIPILCGILGVMLGLAIIAYGQSISCFVSMERGIQDIKNELIKLNKGKQ